MNRDIVRVISAEDRVPIRPMVFSIREETRPRGIRRDESRTTSESPVAGSTRLVIATYLLCICSSTIIRRSMYNMTVYGEIHLPNRYKIGAAVLLQSRFASLAFLCRARF